jgi:phosphatidylglycerophosphatase A
LATLGPLGQKLPAPGTFGSVAGLAVFGSLVMLADISPLLVSLLFLPLFLLGIPLCTKAEKILGKSDPGEIIWDEFTVIPFIFLLIPDKFGAENQIESFIWLLAGFLIFRFFDILKPLGIKRLQALPGGMGVMIDDFVAALFSSVTLFAAKTFPLSFF